jgi:DNA-binding response OmpR family regulator
LTQLGDEKLFFGTRSAVIAEAMQILVVEDQDSIRRMIEALVSARGHKVVAVASGAKAVEMAIQTTPEVVLLDLHLPGQYDGFDVCRKLRATPSTQNVPVIIISAKDDAATRAEATSIGATAYYGKPFSPMALLKEIEKVGRAAKKAVP